MCQPILSTNYLTSTIPANVEPQEPPPVCGRGRASAAKRRGGEAFARNYPPPPQPVIPANAGIQEPPPVCGRGRASAAKRRGGEAFARNYPPPPQPVIPANAGIQEPPPVCGRGRASAAKRGGGEAFARNYPPSQPVIPATAEPQARPSRLREGTRKRSEAPGRRSVRPQLPPPPQTPPVIPANAGIQVSAPPPP